MCFTLKQNTLGKSFANLFQFQSFLLNFESEHCCVSIVSHVAKQEIVATVS